MIHINILLDNVPSSYTGQIVLYLNTGGVRKATTKEEQLLQVIKSDSSKPVSQILESPTST